MARFETYLQVLAEFDYSYHEELQGGLSWLASKREGRGEKARGKPKGKNGGSCEEESSSQEESEMTGGTDLLNSKDTGMFSASLADFVSGSGVGASEEFDESSEDIVKIKRDLKIDNLQSFFDEEDKNTLNNFERDFSEHKASYYQSKLRLSRLMTLFCWSSLNAL